ncbi:MAG: hypothetical protein HYV09_06300 [Deltaproteobacteria bacterium]|nr:hypothetical protein [Deltaproteobacteria bacterium]
MKNYLAVAIIGVTCFGCSSADERTQSGSGSERSGGEGSVIHQTSVVVHADGTREVREFVVTREQYERMVALRMRAEQAKTPDEVRATKEEIAAVKQAVVTQDNSCLDPTSIWIYQDNPAPYGCYSGSDVASGFMLCLKGTGTANLADYVRKQWVCTNAAGEPCYCGLGTCGMNPELRAVPGGWKEAVRAYWPGVHNPPYWASSGKFLDYEKTSCGCSLCPFCYKSFYVGDSCTSANGVVQAADAICLDC